MIIVIKSRSPAAEIERISEEIRRWNITPEKCVGQDKVVIGLVGDTAEIDPRQIQNLSHCIEQVIRVKKPFKRASREFRYSEPTDVVVPTPNGSVTFGYYLQLLIYSSYRYKGELYGAF